MRRGWLVVMAAVICRLSAVAGLTWFQGSIISPRYPWNGDVDFSFSLGGYLAPEAEYSLRYEYSLDGKSPTAADKVWHPTENVELCEDDLVIGDNCAVWHADLEYPDGPRVNLHFHVILSYVDPWSGEAVELVKTLYHKIDTRNTPRDIASIWEFGELGLAYDSTAWGLDADSNYATLSIAGKIGCGWSGESNLATVVDGGEYYDWWTGLERGIYRIRLATENGTELFSVFDLSHCSGLSGSTAETLAGLDTDGDGMPDEFEFEYSQLDEDPSKNLHPYENDADGDIDGDGISNIDEYLSGSNIRCYTIRPDANASLEDMSAGLISRFAVLPPQFVDGLMEFDALVTSYSRFDANLDFCSDGVAWDGVPDMFSTNFQSCHSGYIAIPEDGIYKFFLCSDDGSRLTIGGHTVINHDGFHSAWDWGKSIELSAGIYSIMVDYFQSTGDSVLKLDWQGPSFSRETVPPTVFRHLAPSGNVPPGVAVDLVDKCDYAAGNIIPVWATAWDVDGGIERIEFYADGSTPIATRTEAPYEFLWTNAVGGTTFIEARAYDSFGAMSSATCSVSVAEIPGPGYEYGLTASYYATSNGCWAVRLADRENAELIASCVENNIIAPIGMRGESLVPESVVNDFLSVYEGWLMIRVPGEYEFVLGSDDGSALWLGTNRIICADNTQGYAERSVNCTLGAGFHPIRCEYFQRDGKALLELRMRNVATDRFASIVAPAWLMSALGQSATADSDGDGMTDWWEDNFGLDCRNSADAAQDPDGDGLSNLQEFLCGSNPLVADTDGDGIPDGWEAQHGLDMLMHSDGGLDRDGDGASNCEEYAAGTDLDVVDTDEDGFDDGEELLVIHSDPLAADFDGRVEELACVTESNISAIAGEWNFENDGIMLLGRCGTLVCSNVFQLASASVVQVKVDGFALKSDAAECRCRIDGQVIGTSRLAGFSGALNFYSQYLGRGQHTVAFEFRSAANGFGFRIDRAAVNALCGPDSDGDGLCDWIETRLGWSRPDRIGVVSSKVSPFCITGRALFPESVTVGGVPARLLPDHGWWSNVALNNAGARTVVVNFEGGAKKNVVRVNWSPIDLTTEPDMTLRAGDSLLFNGVAAVSITGASNSIVKVGNAKVPYQFNNIGYYSLAPVDAAGGLLREKPMKVRVVAGSLPETGMPAWKGRINTYVLSDIPIGGVTCDVGDGFWVEDYLKSREGVRVRITVPDYEDHNAAFALRTDNPDASVLCSTRLLGFNAYYTMDDVYYVIAVFEDGTRYIRNRISGFDLPESLCFQLSTLSGICYLDGSGILDISVDDFGELGDCWYGFLTPPELTNPCQFLHAYWNGKEIAQ